MESTRCAIRLIFPALIVLLLITSSAQAEEIRLANGDRISGKIVETTAESIVLETESMGRVTVQRKFIQNDASEKAAAESPAAAAAPRWKGKISTGFNIRQGNTDSWSLANKLKLERKIRKNNLGFEAESYHAYVDRDANAEKYAGSLRDDYDFGDKSKWYGFGTVEADRDRFAEINFRTTPALGAGYIFFADEEQELKLETGAGVTYTDFRNNNKSRTEAVLVPRLFYSKKLPDKSKLTEELIVYPSLSDLGEYRVASETHWDRPLRDRLTLRLSCINEYNSQPGEDAKNNDFRLLTSLVYTIG